ncbi:S1 family peptidase [Streptomyces sp. NPDC021093]|uniref:S1 family peptidase n=1 Tax=Streptomyces sp. NPDC021093 TaxID=3365112 RepID=UPI00379F932C
MPIHHRRSRAAVFTAAAALAAAGLAATATPAAAIQGGKNATTTDHPYTMQLRSKASDGTASEHICGGTLVAPNKVLTAAHCVAEEEGRPPVTYEVVGGRTDLRTTKGTVRQVASIKIHPKFEAANYLYDAAVLTLAKPMPYKPLPVAGAKDTELVKSGRSATALGWGLTATGTKGVRLKAAQLTLSPLKGCDPYTAPTDTPLLKLCGTPATGTFDSICHGDSGGPLVVGGKLVGITSSGNSYCNKEYPTGLFTRTSAIVAGLGLPTG